MFYFTYNKKWQNRVTLEEQTQIWNDIDNIDTDLHVGMSQTQPTLKFTKPNKSYESYLCPFLRHTQVSCDPSLAEQFCLLHKLIKG